MPRSYRSDYDYSAWAYCTNCGRVHEFPYGFQGDMTHCRDCGTGLTYAHEDECRKKSKEVKGDK